MIIDQGETNTKQLYTSGTSEKAKNFETMLKHIVNFKLYLFSTFLRIEVQ